MVAHNERPEHYHVGIWNRTANDGKYPYLEIVYTDRAEAERMATSVKPDDGATMELCQRDNCWVGPDIPICICGHGRDVHSSDEDDPPEVCWATLGTDVTAYCPCDQYEAQP